jgi:hypothetical protein
MAAYSSIERGGGRDFGDVSVTWIYAADGSRRAALERPLPASTACSARNEHGRQAPAQGGSKSLAA